MGNVIGTKSSVRQSKLYRMYESGNNVKSILGQDSLCWDQGKKQVCASVRLCVRVCPACMHLCVCGACFPHHSSQLTPTFPRVAGRLLGSRVRFLSA